MKNLNSFLWVTAQKCRPDSALYNTSFKRASRAGVRTLHTPWANPGHSLFLYGLWAEKTLHAFNCQKIIKRRITFCHNSIVYHSIWNSYFIAHKQSFPGKQPQYSFIDFLWLVAHYVSDFSGCNGDFMVQKMKNICCQPFYRKSIPTLSLLHYHSLKVLSILLYTLSLAPSSISKTFALCTLKTLPTINKSD